MSRKIKSLFKELRHVADQPRKETDGSASEIDEVLIEKEDVSSAVEEMKQTPVVSSYLTIPEAVQEKLWKRMETYMKEKAPYTDPDFDRTVLARALHTNTSYVSIVVNARGKSFSSWVSEYRVRMALEILEQNPRIFSHELSIRVGVMNHVVFTRQFRRIMGISITEYRKKKEDLV